jgi:hypothetical protein
MARLNRPVPFTLSHIAAVLPAHRPLRRRGLLAAAIIGSMIPDFGFLLPWPVTRAQTHGALALVTFCLPMGLCFWYLFQLLVRPAWCAVFPEAWTQRLRADHPATRPWQWRSGLGAAAAILLGALTHLVWDGFTHEGGRGVRMLPMLDDYGPEIVGHSLQLFRWLQLGSSILGLAVVAASAWRWSRGMAPPPPPQADPSALPSAERRAWLSLYVLLPLALLALALALGWQHPRPWMTGTDTARRIAYLALGGASMSLLLVSALIRVRLLRRARLDA